MSQQTNAVYPSRIFLIASGILFLLVGFSAMASPVLYTALIVQLLAVFILVSGVISLVMALLGKHKNYLFLEIVSGIIRIVAGGALLSCLKSSALIITMAFAIYLIVEGLFVIMAALKLRSTPCWTWRLLQGTGALVLGIMVFLRWPSSSFSILGLFFGINLVLNGASQIALGLASRREPATAS
jgi:uncharacterized membrane protein HdeD (DUF308 family)